MPTDPLTAARYPASSANPNVPLDIQNAVNDLSSTTIPRFSTTTARDAAYSAWVSAGHAMTNGLFCVVAGQLMEYRGTWQLVNETKLRQLSITATGTLGAGSTVDLVAAQTVPASMFGTSVPYMIDVDAAVQVNVPAGAGATLQLLFDGVAFYGDNFTNGGSGFQFYTFRAKGPLTVADNATHIVRATLTGAGSTVTVLANFGKVNLFVRPYVTF